MTNKSNRYFSKSRVETFSDGIFAIIVTLLVLEIKVPVLQNHNSAAELTVSLIELLPKIASWIVSFMIVCVIWVNHHRIFEDLKVITHGFFWLNANLLFWCSFIPFPTALLGEYISNTAAQLMFGLILAMMALSFCFMRINILRNDFVLIEGVNKKLFRLATTKSLLFGPLLYLGGALCSFVHPWLSFAVYIIVPLYFILFNSSGREEIPLEKEGLNEVNLQ